jgi:hypothetical protein
MSRGARGWAAEGLSIRAFAPVSWSRIMTASMTAWLLSLAQQ